MMEVIKNKAQANIQRENGITVYPSEEILGSMKLVKEFAAFADKQKINIENVEAHFLLDYCTTRTFTPEELKAFRFGLNCFVKFFEACNDDTESYNLQAKDEERRSVG